MSTLFVVAVLTAVLVGAFIVCPVIGLVMLLMFGLLLVLSVCTPHE